MIGRARLSNGRSPSSHIFIRGFIAAFAVLLTASTLHAHRLDEYLQATTIKIEPDRLDLTIRLTPGVAISAAVVADIDTDGDGAFSESEAARYAAKVGRVLSLSIDDLPQTLRCEAQSFATIESMREGRGDVVLNFTFEVPRRASKHRVTFENQFHEAGAAAYLVNCLVPADPSLQVVSQNRSFDQSNYELTYTVGVAGATPPAHGDASLVKAFLYFGVRHILTGYDHLLFVSALVLASATLWELIQVVSAFTLAHTLTLALAAMGWIHLSDRIVEPLIAGSIVFVALQNVIRPSQSRGWSRLAVTFFFGLFHGLGFAGGLMDAVQQMNGATLVLAIAAFSVGVEVGHQMLILPLFGTLTLLRSDNRARRSLMIQQIGSVLISIAGVYFLVAAFTK